jgi:ABC-type dipeptide/oligopeptide/nickel transport system permease component
VLRKALIRRFMLLVPVLVGVAIVTFTLTLLIPGNPVDAMLPVGATPEERQALIQEFHLDDPPLVRFTSWAWHALQGDFGISISRREPASDVVLRALANTLVLAGLALVFALSAGVVLGSFIANLEVRNSKRLRRTADVLNTVVIALNSLPTFWLGLVALFVFVVKLRLLPVGGVAPVVGPDTIAERARYLVLPILVTGLHPMATMARYSRTFLLEIARQDWVLMLRSRGYSQRRIARHQLRNVIPAIVNIAGLQAGAFISGALFAEQIFSRPGIGTAVIGAIQSRDYPVIQVIVLTTGVMFALITIAVDIVMQVLDRRLSAA